MTNFFLAASNPGIDIFGFRIYYYAICIVTGILAATLFSVLLMKRRNVSPDLIYLLFICCIPMTEQDMGSGTAGYPFSAA